MAASRSRELPSSFVASSHLLCQELEPNCRDGRQQLTFVGEMLVRRIVTYARSTGELPKRELCALGFAQDIEGGIYDRPVQVTMVVGALLCRGTVVGHAESI